MTLKLYNTLTRGKRDFVPLDANNVRMYVCGPTVYDFAHIGNARPVIVFDVLFRLLRHLYGPEHVTYVRNITDVDDKIIARAAEEYPKLPLNEAIRKVTTETEKQFHEDVAALGCLEPTVEPRATEYVRRADGKLDMITLIQRLIDNGCAYVAEGHVLFDVKKMPDYGKLARRSLDEMIAGARVEVAPYKRDPMDFVLWKPSKEGEPAWDSPWSSGRPGWHIECSTMSAALLGETFDIHGGGIDLMFPHHENELAQSRCAFHTPMMANAWMHNGFLQVEGEKMSKSLGNFVTIHGLLETSKFGNKSWAGSVIRLAMLKTQYRQPIDWTAKRLWDAEDQIVQWALSIDDLLEPLNSPILRQVSAGPDSAVVEALCDDLNTHLAIAALLKLGREVRGNPESLPTFLASLDLLGLRPERPANLASDSEARYVIHEKVEKLLQDRLVARRAKNFAEADRIRDELAAMGIVLKDSKDGTTWEIAR